MKAITSTGVTMSRVKLISVKVLREDEFGKFAEAVWLDRGCHSKGCARCVTGQDGWITTKCTSSEAMLKNKSDFLRRFEKAAGL